MSTHTLPEWRQAQIKGLAERREENRKLHMRLNVEGIVGRRGLTENSIRESYQLPHVQRQLRDMRDNPKILYGFGGQFAKSKRRYGADGADAEDGW